MVARVCSSKIRARNSHLAQMNRQRPESGSSMRVFLSVDLGKLIYKLELYYVAQDKIECDDRPFTFSEISVKRNFLVFFRLRSTPINSSQTLGGSSL